MANNSEIHASRRPLLPFRKKAGMAVAIAPQANTPK